MKGLAYSMQRLSTDPSFSLREKTSSFCFWVILHCKISQLMEDEMADEMADDMSNEMANERSDEIADAIVDDQWG